MRRTLDHDGRQEAPELGKLITLAAAEIAIIERVLDPLAACEEYQNLIAECIGIAPWDAVILWNVHAVEPIRRNAARWSAHVAQASLKAEPAKHRHVKLIVAEELSAALNVTRPRIKAIFGTDKCALPPTLIRTGRFDRKTLARLRRIAKDHSKTPEHVGDILAERGPDALAAMVEEWKSEAAKKWERKRKRGRPVDPDGARTNVALVAKQIRVSDSTIWREVDGWKASQTPELADAVIPETPECFVTMTAESCHDDSVIRRSEIPDFLPVSDTEITYSDTHIALAEIAMNRKRRRRFHYKSEDVALLKEWWLATRGREITDPAIRQWAHRGQYARNVFAAQAWREITEIAAAAELTPLDAAAETIRDGAAFIFQPENADDDSIGTLRCRDERPPSQGEEVAGRPETFAHGRG